MTVTDQIKILDRKIMQNEAHYDLVRTDCLLVWVWIFDCWRFNYKLTTVEQAKFNYSPLNKFFNKGLKKKEKKKDF